MREVQQALLLGTPTGYTDWVHYEIHIMRGAAFVHAAAPFCSWHPAIFSHKLMPPSSTQWQSFGGDVSATLAKPVMTVHEAAQRC